MRKTPMRTILVSLAALAASTIGVAVLGAGAAAAQAPTPPFGAPYTSFNACPLNALANPPGAASEDYDFYGCASSTSGGGVFTIKKTTVTLTHPQVVQNGFVTDPDETSPNTLFVPIPADNGKTFVAQPEQVPGGLLGLMCPSSNSLVERVCNALATNGLNAVHAQPQLAGPNLLVFDPFGVLFASPSTPVVRIPLKIKLINPLLGSNCYIGSNSNPIVLNLTPGTTAPPPPNTPITGNPGSLSGLSDPNGFATELIADTGATFVDNAFSVPKSSGCGPLGLFDGAINSKVGLPSAAGHNTAELTSVDSLVGGASDVTTLYDALQASK